MAVRGIETNAVIAAPAWVATTSHLVTTRVGLDYCQGRKHPDAMLVLVIWSTVCMFLGISAVASNQRQINPPWQSWQLQTRDMAKNRLK